ncbi:hypothetical protein KAI87_10470 [Myxococcota bacterium]|nr:hypothetical protein [Myxococcota bacterium]
MRIRLRIDIRATSIDDLKKTLRAAIVRLQGMGPGDSYQLSDEADMETLSVVAMWSEENPEFENTPSLEKFDSSEMNDFGSNVDVSKLN